MSILRKIVWVLLLCFLFIPQGEAQNLGLLVTEADDNPVPTYVYKLVLPNGSLSITGSVGTLDLSSVEGVTVYQSDCSGITAGFCIDTDDNILYYYHGSSVVVAGSVSLAPKASPTFTGTVTLPDTNTLPTTGQIRPATTTDAHYISLAAHNGSDWQDVVRIVNDSGGQPEFQLQSGAAMTGLGNWTVQDTGFVKAEQTANDDYFTLRATRDPTDTAVAIDVITVKNTPLAGTPGAHLRLPEYNCDELSDDTSPHDLIALEVTGTLLNNYDSSAAAKTFNLPAAAQGYNFVLTLGLAQNVIIDPNGSEVIYLNGVAGSAGNSIQNTSPAVGHSVMFYTFQTGASTWAWMAKSSDEEFVATP